ncbi:hypothetical protein SAMN05444401_3121 [Clostridium amylolyticum]|uniref:Uncharacterized protein n=1 Tax=Clostridium amylolyticum TaxID=1121298 RepID=A0A1M6JJ28_9CLOT|nr:hypothetical protein [Clostridium amylolyticum]SHJ46680.1 hypothetical protein SAMN05444401_3121 [Clostridium amylolyticum]
MYYWDFNNFPTDEDRMDYEEIDEYGEFEVEMPDANYNNPFYSPYEYGFRDSRQLYPPGPPPSTVPQKSMAKSGGGGISPKAIDPGQINFCLFKFTYIWQTNGRAYWAYLVKAGRRSIAGFRWRRGRWVYFGLDLRSIDSFFCI